MQPLNAVSDDGAQSGAKRLDSPPTKALTNQTCVADNVTCMDSPPRPKVVLVPAPDAEDDALAALD